MPLTEDLLLHNIRTLFRGRQGRSLAAYADAKLQLGVEALDDAAVIQVGSLQVVVSADFVRGEGFNLFKKGVLNHFDIGYYLAVANLSDVAAMGVAPAALLTTVRYVSGNHATVSKVLRGVRTACRRYNVAVIGGDTGTYDAPVLAATAIGFSSAKRLLRRSGARPGERIFISCFAGLAGTALFYFMQKEKLGLRLSPTAEARLARTWRRPRAEVALARKLVRVTGIGACQDISDGLQRTAEQIAVASKVRLHLDESRFPIHALTRTVASQAGISATTLALSDSVDFGLLVTASKLPASMVGGSPTRGLVDIGWVERGAGCVLESAGGAQKRADGVPWAHQVDDITELIREAGKK